MTDKNPGSLQDGHRKGGAQPQPLEHRRIALNPNDDTDLQRRTGQLWSEVPMTFDKLLWPPALRQLLESDNCQVALLPRRQQTHAHSPEGEPDSAATPATLLPFSWKELVAKVCESVRNFYSVSGDAVTGFADVCVNFGKMEVSRAGEPVRLTAQEFKTLKFLMQNAERVISRDELLNEAWGYQHYPTTRTVDNHILKLRQKLEKDPGRPIHFLTIPRAGYKFVP